MFEKYYDALFVNHFSIINKTVQSNCKEIIFKINEKNKNLKFIVPIVKYIEENTIIFICSFIFLGFYFQNFIIKIILGLLFFDSVIISILVLNKSIEHAYNRRLAKNVISLSILYFNIVGSFFTLLLMLFFYNEYNKFINKIIIKLLSTIITFISSSFPFILIIYPKIKLIDNIKPIDSTSESSSNELSEFSE